MHQPLVLFVDVDDTLVRSAFAPVDDVRVEDWRGAVQLHPNDASHRTVAELRALLPRPG